ncbi:MAG: enoyl-CoA hydratase-related protein [Clostridia bacterium]
MNNVVLEKRGDIAILTLNRPKSFNAINMELLRDLERTAESVERDTEIRVLIITGAGKAFAAGADISEMVDLDRTQAKAFADAGHNAFRRVDELYIPVIAAINGYALGGGCELALCCDIRLAAKSARIGQPEVGIGIVPGFGGTQRLPRVIGVANAMQLALTGKHVSADEAKRMRLVNEVYEDDKLMDAAMDMAQIIASNAPKAVHLCKIAMSRRIERFMDGDLDFESDVFSRCFDTNDQKMAMRAFIDKTPRGEFKGE